MLSALNQYCLRVHSHAMVQIQTWKMFGCTRKCLSIVPEYKFKLYFEYVKSYLCYTSTSIIWAMYLFDHIHLLRLVKINLFSYSKLERYGAGAGNPFSVNVYLKNKTKNK